MRTITRWMVSLVLICGTVALTWAAEGPNPAPASAPAKPTPSEPAGGDWKPLFDGKSLSGWKVTDFAGHGEVEVRDGRLVVSMGAMLSGVNYTNKTPGLDYELSLEAMRVEGSDFFCGLTFPVDDSHLTFVVGGWGGGIVGISSLDGYDASENETTKYLSFEKGKWYTVRVRVTAKKLEAWIDDNKVVNVNLEGRRLSLRAGEIELSKPLGIATYVTTGAFRNIRLRPLSTQ
jgi:hypothetical protein